MEHLLSTYGYLAVFVLMTLEAACIPIPSEVIMLVGGALAGGAIAGTNPSLIGIIAAGTVGNLLGSYLGWLLGRYGGRAAIRRWGRFILLSEHDLDRAERWFRRYGPPTVFFSRILPVIRTFISLPAGLAEMSPIRFGINTLAGCLPWSAALAYLGYTLGSHWQQAAGIFHTVSYIVAALIVVGVIIFGVRFVKRRMPAGRHR